ncbi:MAG: 4-alpha-glucanotransferase [Bacteroidota bacterium]
MKIEFNIHYHTTPGQHICLIGVQANPAQSAQEVPLKMDYIADGHWSCELTFDATNQQLAYKYALLDVGGTLREEWGAFRQLNLNTFKTDRVLLRDQWRAPSKAEMAMYSSSFKNVLLPPNDKVKGTSTRAKQKLQFNIEVSRISAAYQVCITGNQDVLGQWGAEPPLLLACGRNFPKWTASINLSSVRFPLEYKYGLYEIATKKVVCLEQGENRELALPASLAATDAFVLNDNSFRYPVAHWKGAGVAVPVFSLRSSSSNGVGDFKDLQAFVTWAKTVGMKMVQILPVNETIAVHNWLDSYPYKSISVMALHPIYLNLEKMGRLKNVAQRKRFTEAFAELNASPFVRYPEVMEWKSQYFKQLFDQEKATFFKKKAYQTFFKKNESWLLPYAAFTFLRDQHQSADFRSWKNHSQYDEVAIKKLSNKKSKHWEDIAIHYFIQFHLDQQLAEVTHFARENGILLKGDIPIGISPNSVEAWTEPHLFHLDAQAGAPPDDFAIKGQNWGFPTYNWEAMAKENYQWWINRLQKMAAYFDAYRIDHILGFFRIWEVPIHAVEAVLGYFNPALPMTTQEMASFGLAFDPVRMAQPYIRHHLLAPLFGDEVPMVLEQFLDEQAPGHYKMKPAFDTQKKVNAYFLNGIEEEALEARDRKIRDGLFDLIANVLFIQTGPDAWQPRIMIKNTSSFEELDDTTQKQLDNLYIHFFYRRHNDFWYGQGMEKLPAIISASDMLVCGEDLGMVPDCVPPVMDHLNILSLEIQRMSKKPAVRFAHPAQAPYLSVCTTSTHDMPTIRGWWEEDRALIQQFYNGELGNDGSAPYFAEPWVCRQMIEQHLHSAAMWVTLPIQDFLAIDGALRWEDTQEEQINQPSNIRHKWRYRMKQSIEELAEAEEFNALLAHLIHGSGRNSPF